MGEEISEATFRNLLKRYDCPLPAHVARALLMGALAGPRIVSPLAVVDSLWDHALPVFATPGEAQAFYDGLLGYWNRLARHQDPGNPFKLARHPIPRSRQGLAAYARFRGEELAAFMAGFHTPHGAPGLSEELAGGLARLSAFVEMVSAARRTLEDARVPDDRAGAEQLRKTLRQIEGQAGAQVRRLIARAVEERRAAMLVHVPHRTIH